MCFNSKKSSDFKCPSLRSLLVLMLVVSIATVNAGALKSSLATASISNLPKFPVTSEITRWDMVKLTLEWALSDFQVDYAIKVEQPDQE